MSILNRITMFFMLRRADKNKSNPLLKWERYDTAPDGDSMLILCIACVIAFGALVVVLNYFPHETVSECRKV